MTKYLFQSPGSCERILFVRRWRPNSRWWGVYYTPYSWAMQSDNGGRQFIELEPCRSAEEMQRKLDLYAKKYGLAKWQSADCRRQTAAEEET